MHDKNTIGNILQSFDALKNILLLNKITRLTCRH